VPHGRSRLEPYCYVAICKGTCHAVDRRRGLPRNPQAALRPGPHLASQYGFPLRASQDLAQVANYIATTNDQSLPRDEVSDWFRQHVPDFTGRG